MLTEAFEKGSAQAFKEFDKEVVDKKKHEEYERKLQDEIDTIERELLKENKEKTYEYYNKKLPINESASPEQFFSQLKKSFKEEKSSKRLDHDDTLPVEERLEKLVNDP